MGYRREGDLLGLLSGESAGRRHAAFYNHPDPDRLGRDRETIDPESDQWVRQFLAALPPDALVVEIGAGRGAFAGAHGGLVAADISWTALRDFNAGPRVQADAVALPFAARSLDAVVSVFALEHVPDPEAALCEIDRCLVPRGQALLYPAWLVRPWAAKALDRRSYRELAPLDGVRKLTIPVRHSHPYRFARLLPGRLRRELALARGCRDLPFAFRRLSPDLEQYRGPDSDASASMDPEAMSAWFVSREYADMRRPLGRQRLLYRYEPVHVRKRSEEDAPAQAVHGKHPAPAERAPADRGAHPGA